ncbi:MAG TPA: organomercurial lyase [Gaiellaceae bacterium]
MELDNRVRLALYKRFVEDGEPPTAADVAAELGIPAGDAEAAYQRLHEAHVIVLMPGTKQVWMANPLSAVPTAFRVETPGGYHYGNCIWDGLGVVSMLGGDGTVETRCPDCEEPMTLRVEHGGLLDGDGLAHFVVPAARWWDNVGFT